MEAFYYYFTFVSYFYTSKGSYSDIYCSLIIRKLQLLQSYVCYYLPGCLLKPCISRRYEGGDTFFKMCEKLVESYFWSSVNFWKKMHHSKTTQTVSCDSCAVSTNIWPFWIRCVFLMRCFSLNSPITSFLLLVKWTLKKVLITAVKCNIHIWCSRDIKFSLKVPW